MCKLYAVVSCLVLLCLFTLRCCFCVCMFAFIVYCFFVVCVCFVSFCCCKTLRGAAASLKTPRSPPLPTGGRRCRCPHVFNLCSFHIICFVYVLCYLLLILIFALIIFVFLLLNYHLILCSCFSIFFNCHSPSVTIATLGLSRFHRETPTRGAAAPLILEAT